MKVQCIMVGDVAWRIRNGSLYSTSLFTYDILSSCCFRALRNSYRALKNEFHYESWPTAVCESFKVWVIFEPFQMHCIVCNHNKLFSCKHNFHNYCECYGTSAWNNMYVLLSGLIIVFALLILYPLTIAKQICNLFRSKKKTAYQSFCFRWFQKSIE